MIGFNLDIASLEADREAAFDLFDDLTATAPSFHPHPLTREFILGYEERHDVHALLVLRASVGISVRRAVAYGILRGWDDGYEIPSLGIAVASAHRGFGIGRMMMLYLHTVAKVRGSPAVRLRVHEDNPTAIALYSSLGYVWHPDREGNQLVGLFSL